MKSYKEFINEAFVKMTKNVSIQDIAGMYDITIGNDFTLSRSTMNVFKSNHKGESSINILTDRGKFVLTNINYLDNIELLDINGLEIKSQELINHIYESLLLYVRFSRMNSTDDGRFMIISTDIGKAITGDLKQEQKLFNDVYKRKVYKWDNFSDELIQSLNKEDLNLYRSSKNISKYNL